MNGRSLGNNALFDETDTRSLPLQASVGEHGLEYAVIDHASIARLR